MSVFLTKYKLSIAGIIAGALAGFAYYYFIGCNSGTCSISSKPVNSSLYGMLLGYLMFSAFEKSKQIKQND